jgi:plasmid stability protein
MAQVLIRNLDDDVLARLKEHAAARKISPESLLHEIVTRAAGITAEKLMALARQLQADVPMLPSNSPRAADLIREDRDAR